MATKAQGPSGNVSPSTSIESISDLRNAIADVQYLGARILLHLEGVSQPTQQDCRQAFSLEPLDECDDDSCPNRLRRAYDDLETYRINCAKAKEHLTCIPKGLFDDADTPLILRWSTTLLVLLDELTEFASWFPECANSRMIDSAWEVALLHADRADWKERLSELSRFDRQIKIALNVADNSDELTANDTLADATVRDNVCDTRKIIPKKKRRVTRAFYMCAEAFRDAILEEPNLSKSTHIKRWARANRVSATSLLRISNDHPEFFHHTTKTRQA